MRYLQFILPSIVAILCVMGIVFSNTISNGIAMNAYIMAAIGWLIVASNAFIDFLNQRKSNV